MDVVVSIFFYVFLCEKFEKAVKITLKPYVYANLNLTFYSTSVMLMQ